MKKTYLIPLILLAISPIFIFWYYFHNQEISNNSEHWYFFAAYIGGTAGTIASLISVFLLYMTLNKQIVQQFESTFFNLLSAQRDIVKNMEGNIEDKSRVFITYNGIAYINALANKIERVESCNLLQNRTLSAYFEHLKEILRYIDETKCDIKQSKKEESANFIRAQMSKNERDLLKIYYNYEFSSTKTMTDEEKEDKERHKKFKGLIDRYKLLK